MKGRDLILYILQNQLEDEPVYADGVLLGFMREMEAALYFGVGTATIRVWYEKGMIDGIKIGDMVFISATAKHPIKGDNHVQIV